MIIDTRIQAGIIAFVAALLATAITGYINYRLVRVKAEEDRKLSDWENKRAKKEETLSNLFLLSTMLSFSKIDMAGTREEIKFFNENFDSANELIANIRMSLSLYFPEYSDEFEPVLGESTYYWKCYKDYLVSEEPDSQGPESSFQRSLQASLECQEIIRNIESKLANVSKIT